MCISQDREIPDLPQKDRIIKLLNNTHSPSFPNWTIFDQQEVYILLRSLAFYHFRTNKVLIKIEEKNDVV